MGLSVSRPSLCMLAYSRRSLAVLLFSSSLYLFAAFEVYLTFVSLLARAAVPPFDWKNLVADSLPPTLKLRSWSHCQTKHVRNGRDPRYTTYRRGWSTEQRRCERLGSGGSKSSQDIDRHQMGPTTMLGSSGRSQSISRSIRQGYLSEGWECLPCWLVSSSVSQRSSATALLWHSWLLAPEYG